MTPTETTTAQYSLPAAVRLPAPRSGKTRTTIAIAAVAAVLGVIGGGAGGYWFGAGRTLPLTSEYQAVLLTNGSAYFGRLEGLGTRYPVLRDVFYVQNTQDPQTKQVSNVLVKRGKEWHAPDRMILNANMIEFVEPVSPSSRVAQLIAQAKSR